MPAADYGRSLAASGQVIGFNLIVRDIDAALPFHLEVLAADIVYHDPDIAVLRRQGAQWMLHAHHTYDSHPWHPALVGDAPRGVATEHRLFGRDPDAAESAARGLGFRILQGSADKPHGLREVFIVDQDGFVWAIGQALEGR